MTKDALVIPADGQPYKTEIDDSQELEQLQSLVGGYIELVVVDNEEGLPVLSVFCNEEGKIEGLPRNGRANHFFRAVLSDDVLVGPVVMMGPADADGETTSLDYVDEWLKAALDISDVDLQRWDDWDDLRAREALATTPDEIRAIEAEKEELHRRGMQEVMDQDMTKPETWWWVSFADPNLPEGEQFLGVIIIMGGGIGEITQKAFAMGINPGGEVKAIPIPDEHVPDERFRNKLLSKQDLIDGGLIDDDTAKE